MLIGILRASDDPFFFQGAGSAEDEEELLEHFQFKEKQSEDGEGRVLY